MKRKELMAREAKAAELGAQAFAAGKLAAPALDGEFCKLLPGLNGADTSRVLDSWIGAWHRANLAAPVPELRDDDRLGRAIFGTEAWQAKGGN